MKTALFGKTDLGCRRKNNEDAFLLSLPEAERPWAIVCDGMGGAAAGEVASRLAVERLAQAFATLAPGAPEETALARFAREANDAVLAAAGEPGRWGMGTTLVAALFDPAAGKGWIVHAGDSRAYLLRGATLERLTEDHNWGEELRRAGIITPPGARASQEAAALTRVLGMEEFPGADVAPVEFLSGDRLLLATDGFTGQHGDGEIGAILSEGSAADVPAAAVASARARGGPDNITVVVAQID